MWRRTFAVTRCRFRSEAALALLAASVSCGGADGYPRTSPRGGAPVVGLAIGWTHACASLANTTAWCWGHNEDGELGEGTTRRLPGVVQASSLHGVRQLSLGRAYGCAALDDGSARCWGDGQYGQLGDDVSRSPEPRLVPDLPDVVEVAAGIAHTCFLTRDGAVSCRGGSELQLVTLDRAGEPPRTLGRQACPGKDRHCGITIPGLPPAVHLASGYDRFCALLADTSLRCWDFHPASPLEPLRFERSALVSPGLRGVKDVSVGARHACALLEGGEVRCWGSDEQGQLGSGGGDSPRPTPVRDLPPSRAIAAGAYHSCALALDGTVRCWGQNTGGETGVDAPGNRRSPERVRGVDHAVQIACGATYTCALREDGAVFCWGGGSHTPRLQTMLLGVGARGL